GPDDVLPFMRNVTAGRDIPDARLEEVSGHYHRFGGRSPINDQNRALIAALEDELAGAGIDLPVHFGNRNWHPFLADTLADMRARGHRRALAVMTSAYSSYSGCRQYREDVARARAEVGDGAPTVDKVRVFYNHPGFVEAQADRVREALATLPSDRRDAVRLVFTTHSVPRTMSRHSDYEAQTYEACRLVVEALGEDGAGWDLVFNSRSGPPSVAWLGPDVNDHLEALADDGCTAVVVVPIGFVSDHMEVIYDLDVEAAETAARVGLSFVRAGTVGTHPRFVAGLRELVEERLGTAPRRALGTRGPCWDACPLDCCLTPGQERLPAIADAPAASRPR
ncbi:MAG: ferrochelatase, partial [Actinobacteria bacterium]|nr:ferrochelatase [Actinomycetota bacterium]